MRNRIHSYKRSARYHQQYRHEFDKTFKEYTNDYRVDRFDLSVSEQSAIGVDCFHASRRGVPEHRKAHDTDSEKDGEIGS